MTDLSPARLQVMWNRLLAVVEEQGQTLIRAAFSPIVRECGDISAGIFDALIEVGDLLGHPLPLVGAGGSGGREGGGEELVNGSPCFPSGSSSAATAASSAGWSINRDRGSAGFSR